MPSLAPEELLRRLLACDKSLWPEGNVSSNRLGWLEVPREIEREARALSSWAESIDQETVILLGMGGSSLGPLVLASLAQAFGSPSGRRLMVCDTTAPETILEMPFEDSFVLVSSKSGTTLEPNVLFDYARSRVKDEKRFAVISDDNTPLAQLAKRLRVNQVFANRPDIGGRYSVLSHFGMVPAALLGYDLTELCGRAMEVDKIEAVELGVAMAQAALEGRDKATIVIEEAHRAFGLWVEQLIAESTGKLGKGIVPVPTSEHELGEDRFAISVSLPGAHEVAAQFYRFEIATAVAGALLEIDPFDEPNVAESKANTNKVLENLPLANLTPETPDQLGPYLAETIRTGDYVCLQAYLPFGNDAALEALRKKVRDDHGGIATTAGYGPRFLHSTGQLHKGGPPSVIAVQIVARSPRAEVSIPDKPYDFATLIEAQASGDHQSLLSHKRRVLRLALDSLDELL